MAISATVVGDLTPVLRHAPRLRTLRAVGGSIGLAPVEHDRLESLTLETGGLPHETAEALSSSRFPALESLTVYFGSSDYGATVEIEALLGLMKGEGLPKLRHLGLVNAEYQDALVSMLTLAPILGRLRSLDLSLGTMTEGGVVGLLVAAPRFGRLERIDLRENYIPERMHADLRAALPGVELLLDGQRTPSEYGGELHYYVSVGE